MSDKVNPYVPDFMALAEIGDVIKVGDEHDCVECIGQFGNIVDIEDVWQHDGTCLKCAKCYFPSLDDTYWVSGADIGWLWKGVH